MILRVEILKSDLAHMKGTLDPANIDTADLMALFMGWGTGMRLASVIYYQEGPRRYYWKNRVTGKTGWDNHHELEG